MIATPPSRPHVLLALDDREMRALLIRVLHEEGYALTECREGIPLLDQLVSHFLKNDELPTPNDFDLLIADVRIPGIIGLNDLNGIQKIETFPPIILITAFGDKDTHAYAKQIGAAAIFDKPFEMHKLLATF
jgi:two-component system response regulator (stage 0 sporulation protein F)